MNSDAYKSPTPALIDHSTWKNWIIQEDEDLLVFNKPGWVVCHPSKNGPCSSLVGASRKFTKIDKLHLISRLDRETSGIVIVAKNRNIARKLQIAIQERQVQKTYYALLEGELRAPITVNQHLAKSLDSPVYIKQAVRKSNSSKRAETKYIPFCANKGFTLAKVIPITGRQHQIRAHALWLGNPVVGDKLYGHNDTLYLDFIKNGWTDKHEKQLQLQRQALHAQNLRFLDSESGKTFLSFSAPFHDDMDAFIKEKFNISINEIEL